MNGQQPMATGTGSTSTPASASVLACDECWPRRRAASWWCEGTDELKQAWRAAVCDEHLVDVDELIAERGGIATQVPAHHRPHPSPTGGQR